MNRETLKRRILRSGDFTALEKRYLEQLIDRERIEPPPPCEQCAHLVERGGKLLCGRRGECFFQRRQDI